MAEMQRGEREFQGGAQPVREQPPESPIGGWTAAQVVVVAISVLVVIAAILWLVVPLGT